MWKQCPTDYGKLNAQKSCCESPQQFRMSKIDVRGVIQPSEVGLITAVEIAINKDDVWCDVTRRVSRAAECRYHTNSPERFSVKAGLSQFTGRW